jgi:hypothetical protein
VVKKKKTPNKTQIAQEKEGWDGGHTTMKGVLRMCVCVCMMGIQRGKDSSENEVFGNTGSKIVFSHYK